MATTDKRYLFLIDDEPIQNEMLKDYLTERYLFDIKVYENGEEALKNMDLNPEIIVLDFHLNAQNPNAKDGVDILKEIKNNYPDVQVIMLSGQDKIEIAVDTIRFGAYDYVVKGESAFSRIENVVNNISEYRKMKIINQSQRKTITLLVTVISIIILWAIYFFMVRPYIQ